ncbi:hypothetical protein BX600DRAFT_460827 [Xylariales sp. PMI_506]|nr:hypothetical protein BX600DRAFT_460827 [Xylariales sp. PMI_506]
MTTPHEEAAVAAAAATTELITYQGNCHCGRYRYEVTVPEIKSATTCACALCTKTGALWLPVPPGEGRFRVVRDDDRLGDYETPVVRAKFCKDCGNHVSSEHLAGELSGQTLINVRDIREPYVNPFKIESETTTAAAPAEDTRPIEGLPEPANGELPAQLVFACHCGKVQAELLTPISEQEVKEDNCSLCVRDGYIGVYPNKSQVRLHGVDPSQTFEYQTGRKFGGNVHCQVCGVFVFSNVYGPPISIFDRLPPERRERALAVYHANIQLKPLNVRSAEVADLAGFVAALEVKREDEGTDGYVLDA